MKPEVKANWVKALRSGEYRQGTVRMRNEDGEHCCLGVLTDLYCKDTGKEWPYDGDNNQTSLLDGGVMKWAGLAPTCAPLRVKGDDLTLAQHNDSGMTFGEIADKIERGTVMGVTQLAGLDV